MLYLTTHSTNFIYGYIASNKIMINVHLIMREETRCRQTVGYSTE